MAHWIGCSVLYTSTHTYVQAMHSIYIVYFLDVTETRSSNESENIDILTEPLTSTLRLFEYKRQENILSLLGIPYILRVEQQLRQINVMN